MLKQCLDNIFNFFRGPMVRCLKGYSNTAIGLSAVDIIIAILRNTQAIIPVSTLVQVYINMHVCHVALIPKILYSLMKKSF